MKPQYKQQTYLLKALAQPVRLEILEILSRSPACVCDLMMHTGQRQPYISQQLIVLKQAGLVSFYAEGAKKIYQLNSRRMDELIQQLLPLAQKAPRDSKGK